jgi:hypothetical protein
MTAKKKSTNIREIRSIPARTFVDDYIYRIDLDADYQREKIWKREDQERLIDSIHQNIDIPKIYLARVAGNENFDFECIDGKQRMTALMNFFKPEGAGDTALTLRVGGERYTYKQLKAALPQLARKMEDFELTFVIYPEFDDEGFLRDLFRRLQLGVRLNSGELLNSHMGAMRDFVYKEMGKDAPFLKHTGLSEKRFSRQFALAQMCINSFSLSESGTFVRARYDDLEDFFKEKSDLDKKDPNFARIKEVLALMDEQFGERAANISSRAVAVSAYLFVEHLHVNGQANRTLNFVDFYLALLEEIKSGLKQLTKFREPKNPKVLEEFQKYISQASVEPYAIKRRQLFLEGAFEYYRSAKTKGRIIGSD